MLGAGTHPDIEHAEVSVSVGKNPWMSHGFARARVVLKEIEKDPKRSLIVIDPRRSETAAMADYHLAIEPGTDAWGLASLVAILVQENLIERAWLAEHTTGSDVVELLKHGTLERKGVAPNELTSSDRRDFLAGTPWHKHVPARVMPLPATTS